ncbi:MAG: cupredoxin domain-containing protein [Candidatus Eremiobacteraeota bacterium]|nr:cupredoxin domain-containing protein [Candidatus Eremiobacteraeota bacterium]
MRSTTRVPITVATALALVALAGLASSAKPHPTPPDSVSVVATAEQKFVPAVIVMHVGRPTTVRFSSSGGVHGVASTELGIPATTIMPDTPVSVVVTPKKVGTYKLPCTIVCGPNHADMLLTVQVKP